MDFYSELHYFLPVFQCTGMAVFPLNDTHVRCVLLNTDASTIDAFPHLKTPLSGETEEFTFYHDMAKANNGKLKTITILTV